MSKRIVEQVTHTFDVPTDGLYLIEIEASCQAGRLFGFWGGEDLRVEIDDVKFREIPTISAAQYFNVAPAWNGSQLKGLFKKVIFILKLTSGQHRINFFPKGGASLENDPVVKPFTDNKLILNTQAKDGNRRPWITVVLIDLPLNVLDISVKCEKRSGDSDDVKLLIDGVIQKNPYSKWWGRNWYWRGSHLLGNLEITRFYPGISKGVHYIELWADRQPLIKEISFGPVELNKQGFKSFTVSDVKQYAARGTFKNEDYNRFDKEIVEAVNHWNKEIFSQETPPPEVLHPDLVKAMVYIESRVGYLETNPGAYRSHPDVMQVANTDNPAIHTFHRDGWIDPVTKKPGRESELINGKVEDFFYPKANGSTPAESIFWGTRWLYHKAQGVTFQNKRYWKPWLEAVLKYNGRGDDKYVQSVYDAYLYGIDRRNKLHPIKLWIIAALLVIGWTSFYNSDNVQETQASGTSTIQNLHEQTHYPVSDDKPIRKLMDEKMKIYVSEIRYTYADVFEEPYRLCQKDSHCASDLIFPTYVPELVAKAPNMHALIQVLYALNIIDSHNSHFDDLDNDGQAELIFALHDFLNHDFIELSVIDDINGNLKQVRSKVHRSYMGGPLKIMDLTGDAVPELLLFTSGGRQDKQLFIYQYRNAEINEQFALDDDYLRVDFIFTDQNRNKIPEIKIVGEKYGLMPFNFECMACQHMKIEEVFEYNPKSKEFQNIKADRLGIPGAFYRFIKDVLDVGLSHPMFAKWTKAEKQRFQISIDELRENGLETLFATFPQEFIDEGDGQIVTLNLLREIRLRDLAERAGESEAAENERLGYYNNSPVYEAVFRKNVKDWALTSFREILPTRGLLLDINALHRQ